MRFERVACAWCILGAVAACGGGDIGGEDVGSAGAGASGLAGVGAGTGNTSTSGSGGDLGGGGMVATGGTMAAGGMSGSGGDPSTTSTTTSTSSGGPPPTGCGADGIALIDAINAYRMQNGLSAIPASSSLCIVAETHVNDLRDHAPHQEPGGCNLHSWSDQGSWTPCCYTPDHNQAQCMWMKPSELAGYNSSGYEISYAGGNNPSSAVNSWSNSSGHRNVILNQDIWTNYDWQAIGAAQHDGYAHVWFGTLADPN